MTQKNCQQSADAYRRFIDASRDARDYADKARTDKRLRGEAIERLRNALSLPRELRIMLNERFFREFNPEWRKNARLLENYENKRTLRLRKKAESFRIFDDCVVAEHKEEVFEAAPTRTYLKSMRSLVAYPNDGTEPREIFPEKQGVIFWGGRKTVAVAVCADGTMSFISRDKKKGWTVQTEENKFGLFWQISFFSENKAVGLSKYGKIVVWEKDALGKMQITQSFGAKTGEFGHVDILPDETIVATTSANDVSLIKPNEAGRYEEREEDYFRFDMQPERKLKKFLVCGDGRFCATFSDGTYQFIRKGGTKDLSENWQPFGSYEISRVHALSGKDADYQLFRVLPNGLMFCGKDLIVRGGLPKKDVVVGGIDDLSGEFRARYMHHCLGNVTVTALADEGVLLQDNRNVIVEWHNPGNQVVEQQLTLWAEAGIPMQIAETGEIYIAEKDGSITVYGKTKPTAQ